MNAENQTLQNRELSRATKKEQERRPSVKRYHAICEALSLGKKNGEVETQYHHFCHIDMVFYLLSSRQQLAKRPMVTLYIHN